MDKVSPLEVCVMCFV